MGSHSRSDLYFCKEHRYCIMAIKKDCSVDYFLKQKAKMAAISRFHLHFSGFTVHNICTDYFYC